MRISDWSSDVCSSDLVGIAPHAVGRQHSGQPFECGGAIVEAGRIGVGQRLVDMQADMSGAPSVIKADVQQMRCQRQLRHDAGLIEKVRSEEHTSELQSLMRISYAVFCLKKKKN